MIDINDRLKLLSSLNNMDFNEDFSIIKSVIDYCYENIEGFQEIQYYGVNNEIIGNIVKRLLDRFTEKGYYTNDSNKYDDKFENEMRKITFFLILNTDATFKYNLNDDTNIVHIINIIPHLPKILTVSIISQLNLDKFFYEIISYSPSWFAFQFIEPIFSVIKNMDPFHILEKVEITVKAILTNIGRMDLINLDIVDKKIILEKYYSYIGEFLKKFYTPNAEKFPDWTVLEYSLYSGYAIKHLIDMILYSFDIFEHKIDQNLNEKFVIYQIGKNIYGKLDNTTYTDDVFNYLLKIIKALQGSLYNNVMQITCEAFIDWVEDQINATQTLQLAIGESAYNLIERMKLNPKYLHNYEKCLQTIAIRPETAEEKITKASVGKILEELTNDKNESCIKKIWFEELFKRPYIYGNEECLEIAAININLATINVWYKILDSIKSDIGLDLDNPDDQKEFKTNYDDLISIIISGLNYFNIDNIQNMIKYEIKLFGKDTLLFKSDNLKEKSIELFNKLTNEFNTKLFLQLCFEHPSFMWAEFFKEAYTSKIIIKHFCSTYLLSKDIAKIYIDSLILKSFINLYNEELYPTLMYEIFSSGVMEANEFLKIFIYENLTDMLEIKKFSAILSLLKILEMATQKKETFDKIKIYLAPLIVILAQILDISRWDLCTYSDIRDKVLRLTIHVGNLITKKYLPIISEKEKNWISAKLVALKPLTLYYFQKYYREPCEQINIFDKYLHPENFIDDESIQLFLLSTLVRCTSKETEWLAKSSRLIHHITPVIQCLAIFVKDTPDENKISNYRHCIINYANIITSFLIPELNDKIDKYNLLKSMINIIKSSIDEIYEEVFLNLQSILFNLLNDIIPIDDELIEKLRNSIKEMKDCTAKELLVGNFETIILENC